jgi:hypothetical protein
MLNIYHKVFRAFGQEISVTKTKVMVTVPPGMRAQEPNITLDGKTLEVVTSFRYLGSWANIHGDMASDVDARVRGMYAAYARLKERVFQNPQLTLAARLEVYYAVVQSVGLYGCAAWNLKKEHIDRLEQVNARLLRKMVPGADSYTSLENIIILAAKRNCLIRLIEVKVAVLTLRYLGHVARMKPEAWQLRMSAGYVAAAGPKLRTGGQLMSYDLAVLRAMKLCGIKSKDWATLAGGRGGGRPHRNWAGPQP